MAKPKFSIGLDCGTSTVKLIRLRSVKDAVELSDCRIEPAQLDLEPVFKKMTQGLDALRVNISVSAPAAIIRYVNFPKMDKEELRQALKFEAQKHIPFSISEVNVDSYILKADMPDNKMLVLLAAVKNDFLSQRLKVIEAAGLRANVIDVDSLALVNSFNFCCTDDETIKNKTVALLNVGAAFSNLSILDAGIPRLGRDIQIAGNALTQRISEAMGVDYKAAEAIKVSGSSEQRAKAATAIESVLSNLAREVRVSFDYYESQNASSVGKIFISGGSSSFPGLKDMLAAILGIEVECWDPLKKLKLASNLPADSLKPSSAQLAVALGLALRA